MSLYGIKWDSAARSFSSGRHDCKLEEETRLPQFLQIEANEFPFLESVSGLQIGVYNCDKLATS